MGQVGSIIHAISDLPNAAFMAQHDGRLGTLFITASWIRFAPIQTSTSTKDVKPESSTGTDIDTISSITPASDIKIAMEDIISINKIDRTAVKLKVTSGLSFQKKDGSVSDRVVGIPSVSFVLILYIFRISFFLS